MIKILFSWVSIPRFIGIWIDSIAFALVDDLYNLIVDFSKLEFFSSEAIKSVMKSTYVVISIFALFRIAIILVNAIINPDKLTDSKNGFLPVLRNFVLMFVLLVLTPRLFTEAYKIQSTIVEGNYIQKLFLRSSAKAENPGKELKKIVVSSLVYPDKNFATYDAKEGYKINGPYADKCDGNCKKAIEAYNDDVLTGNDGMFTTLSKYIGTSKKVDTNDDGDSETIFVYNYMFIVTFVAGIFITYVLASMGLDIAIRAVELAVLQIISPLFIVTMIDPKSVQSGPFKKWLQTVGKTYVSLFIKIAILTLMTLLISILNTASLDSLGFLGKLVAILAILIFAKKAPKWIGNMVGVEGDSSGLGGLGKKLGSAALVGGAISKGLEGAKKFGTQKGKNFFANRARNTAARVGGMKEAHKANKELKNNPNSNQKKQSLWQSGRAAAKLSKANNYGKDSEGLLKDIAGGYMAGRLNINPEAKGLNAKLKEKAERNAYNEKIGNTQEARQKRKEMAENNAEAKKLYKDVSYGNDGDRLKVKGPNGEDVYVNPRGPKEINQAIGTATTELDAFKQLGTNMVNGSMGKLSLNGNGQVVDVGGKVIANSAAEYALQNTSLSGKLAIKSAVASNVEKDIQSYENCLQKISSISRDYTEGIGAYNDAVQKLNVNTDYQNAQNTIKKVESLANQRAAANNTILKITNSSDYQYLSNQEHSKLTPEEQKRLASYNVQYKQAVETSNNCISRIKQEQQNYNNAVSVVDQIEKQTGVSEIKEKYEKSKQELDAWKKQAADYENKFKTSEVYKINDEGKISTSKENPYEVKIDGKTYNPAEPDAKLKFEEIKDIISTKASKAKDKYNKSLETEKE